MDLVICNTPFQILQVQNLVEKGIIVNFELFYFCSRKTEQIDYYFKLLKDSANKATLYVSDKKFPYHILNMRKIFKGKRYQNIYSASVDSVYTHSILSFTEFSDFYSFDDGSANLIDTSCYYIDQRNNFKKILFKLFGCHYDLKKTKSSIKNHFTIYKNLKNITSNTIEVDFDFYSNNSIGSNINKKPVANVLLGTVFDEMTLNREDKQELIKKISLFIKDKNFYYIPHPRDFIHYFDGVKYIDGLEIAESKILYLLSEYECVNLYGFNSSVQINLRFEQGVKVYYIKNSLSDLVIDSHG